MEYNFKITTGEEQGAVWNKTGVINKEVKIKTLRL